MGDRYPMRIRMFIIFQAPLIIRGAIKIAKVILSKKLSGRIVPVKSAEELNKLITNDNLPPKFDTNSAWDFVLNTSTNALSLSQEEEEEDEVKSEDDDSK